MAGVLKVIYTCILLAAASVAAAAQAAPSWHRIVGSGDGFAVDIPAETIIINEGRDYARLILSSYEVRFTISRQPNRGPKYSALRNRPHQSAGSKESTFELGDVVGRINISERPGRSATLISASSGKYVYAIGAYGRRSDHPSLVRFLASLRFGGEQLFKLPVAAGSDVSKETEMKHLENSPIVEEYLAKPVNKNIDIRYETPDRNAPYWAIDTGPSHDYEKETRSLIILQMPKPEYRPLIGTGGGSVEVHVTLLRNGQVGAIVADPASGRELAKSAADAARKIKFIPAEVGGELVDVRRRFIYGFSVR